MKGGCDYSALAKVDAQLQELLNGRLDAIIDEKSSEAAAALLSKLKKRTPVGKAPHFDEPMTVTITMPSPSASPPVYTRSPAKHRARLATTTATPVFPSNTSRALRPAQSPLCSFRAKTKKLPKYSGSATSAVSMRRLSVEIGRTTSKRSTPSPVWVLSRYIGHGTQTLHLRVFSRRKVRMHGLKPFPAYRKK